MKFQDHTEKWSERTAITVECLNQVISFPFTLYVTGILFASIFLPEEIEDKGPYFKKFWPYNLHLSLPILFYFLSLSILH